MDPLYPVTLQINPNCLNFLEANKQQSLSWRQKNFMQQIKETYDTLSALENQPLFEFTPANKAEITRGAFYALTRSLEEKFSRQRKINLTDLESCFKEEFKLSDEPINFIIRCLLEPVGLPLFSSALAHLMLIEDYYCSNESTQLDPRFQYALKAEPGVRDGTITFKLALRIKKGSMSQALPIGSTDIRFSINDKKQIEFAPIEMRFNFTDKEESERFQAELVKDFKGWLLTQDELANITLTPCTRNSLWLISVLIGLLVVGLITLITLVALSLTPPIMPLLIPPAGLTLGLLLASFINTCSYMSARGEQKIQRPIRLLNRIKAITQSQFAENYTRGAFFQPRHKLDLAPPPHAKASIALKAN